MYFVYDNRGDNGSSVESYHKYQESVAKSRKTCYFFFCLASVIDGQARHHINKTS